jgi:hypothetical protein
MAENLKPERLVPGHTRPLRRVRLPEGFTVEVDTTPLRPPRDQAPGEGDVFVPGSATTMSEAWDRVERSADLLTTLVKTAGTNPAPRRYRDESIHDDGRPCLFIAGACNLCGATTPAVAPTGPVAGCPHRPACAGYCPVVETRSVVDREPPQDSMPRPGQSTRGTTNRNARGNAEDRRRRRAYLIETFRADVDVAPMTADMIAVPMPLGEGWPACRCYRCGTLLTEETVSPDRIIPGCRGGTYRRDNIRPACLRCQSVVGGGTRR